MTKYPCQLLCELCFMLFAHAPTWYNQGQEPSDWYAYGGETEVIALSKMGQKIGTWMLESEYGVLNNDT